MRERYKNALMWGLYAALVLLVLVLQTVSFGRPRFFGVKLCFVPVLVACVSMHVEARPDACSAWRVALSGRFPARTAARCILCYWRSAARLRGTSATGILCGIWFPRFS